ncbi:prolyl 4-hydroxylase alpha [Colletotrichum truncatum]|uniref:Prolyl 4-hydroxylase alpha n=1 Tax=Colletotrichum truncatum TaxID=5467 RepID=A0ACC3Z7R3_COLTU|nr:prolyl 4-hydroxylase alpha [Colletotrichum truncatum]KAF6782499.1 prolyl 4-hydroxylase alpha [Colletotrichum truncatum]
MRSGLICTLFAATGVLCMPNSDNDLKDYTCDHSGYQINLFSHSPLVIYITNFLTSFEQEHLKKITNGTFARSQVASSGGDILSSHRTSQSTTVVPDAVTECIQERARRFQGLDMAPTHLEPIQLVKYGLGEQYHFHTDWFPADSGEHGSVAKGGNRVSSFFTYVAVSDDIAGGGTNFPRLQAPPGKGWCKYVDCDEPWDAGVTFRPIKGNAVFWTNLVEAGEGDERVLHAGLPVVRGEKLGMNIWTKQGPFN